MSMTAPIAVQLYSVRDKLAGDFRGTLEKISAMGYLGVETAGFPDRILPLQAGQIFAELGLSVTSAHSPLPLGRDKTRILESMDALGCTHLVSPWMDPEHYRSEESIRALAETFNQAYEICAENGLRFSIHNHDFEFMLLEGRPAIQTLREYLHPEIYFELDTYWIHVAGQDPAEVVAEMSPRAPLLHIKDGPGVRGEPMLPIGDGVMDVPAIIEAGRAHTEWLIVELDACATDMLAALERSYRYLTLNGLARGR